MTDDDPRLAGLRANAALAISEFGELSGRHRGFGIDRASVAWVEGYIERLRVAEPNPDGRIVSVLGSYLGEAIIGAAGGRWTEGPDGSIGVVFANGDGCYPFAKVARQFQNGVEGGDGILSFYGVSIDEIASGRLNSLSGSPL
jgi:hypothetical protein